MINKQNLLGKTPDEAGIKDAVHVAIVSVRAAEHIARGQRFKLNEFNEAVADKKGFAVVDPFRKSDVTRGDVFWGLLDQREVPNVRHVWEHPEIKEFTPTREPQKNKYLSECAEKLKVSYTELMSSISQMVNDETPEYTGTLTEQEVKELLYNCEIEESDVFQEWADETGHEFQNDGSDCCPEYDYPEFQYKFKQE